MLVLSRRPQETIVVGGGISITVVSVQGNQVRLGIEAPRNVPIRRGELSPSQCLPRGADVEEVRTSFGGKTAGEDGTSGEDGASIEVASAEMAGAELTFAI